MRPDLRFHPLALLAGARGRLRALFARNTLERDLQDEMRFHLDMETERHMKNGMSESEARRAAAVAFGGAAGVVEEHRDARGTRVLEEGVADARYAARSLGRTPGFVAVSVFTLMIAIAIGTTLFTAVNGFFYRPLPVPEGDRLISVFTSDFSGREFRGGSSFADLDDFQRETASIARLAGFARITLALGRGDEVGLANGELVSSRYFEVLGVAPASGRFFGPVSSDAPAIVIGHSLWRRAFGSDSSVVGSQVRMNGQSFTVIGVAPAEFRGASREFASDFWIDARLAPLVAPREDPLSRRTDRRARVVARLRGTATLEAFNARLDIAAAQLFHAYPKAWQDTTGNGRSVTAMWEGEAHLSGVPWIEQLQIIGGVVALGLGLLVVASANLASMQMARGAARRREIATRLALGASRARIIRQLLSECALVAIPGVIAGVVLAVIVAALVSHYSPPALPSLNLSLDWRALAFIGSALTLIVLVFGLVPALQTARADVLTDLKGGDAPGSRGVRVGGVRGGLIVAQVALSVVFTAGSALVALALVRNASLGRDDARKVLVTRLNFLPAAGDSIQVRALATELVAAIGALPGVEASAAADFIPRRGSRRTVLAEVRDSLGQVKARELDVNAVGPEYFRVVGTPVIRGRPFEPREMNGRNSVIVTKQMADALWPGEDALGKRMTVETGWPAVKVVADVVGVVADVPGQGPATERSYPGLLYLPLRLGGEAEVVLHFRAPSGQAALVPQVMERLRRENARVVAPEVITLDEYLERDVLPQRIMARASAVLAALQLLLAIAGLSGLVAYVTALRRREIGIRSALGATRRSLLTLVMRQGIRLTLVGGAIGLAVSIAVEQVVAAMLPMTASIAVAGVLVAAATFAIVGTVAMLVPARRALDVTPAVALRVD